MSEYVEKQKFNPLWGYLIFTLTVIINYFYISKYNRIDNIIVITTISIAFVILLLFELCSLTTMVNKNGISYKFWPFHRSIHNIKWTEINKVTLKKYRPLKDYGGWGLRKSTKNGKAYTTGGDIGIIIETKKDKILLGTQNEDQINEILKKLIPKKYNNLISN